MTKIEYILKLSTTLARRRINFNAYTILAYAAKHEGREIPLAEIADALSLTANCAYGHINRPLAGCFVVNSAERILTYRINRKGSELLRAIEEEISGKAVAS